MAASKVRELAQRLASATREIKTAESFVRGSPREGIATQVRQVRYMSSKPPRSNRRVQGWRCHPVRLEKVASTKWSGRVPLRAEAFHFLHRFGIAAGDEGVEGGKGCLTVDVALLQHLVAGAVDWNQLAGAEVAR